MNSLGGAMFGEISFFLKLVKSSWVVASAGENRAQSGNLQASLEVLTTEI